MEARKLLSAPEWAKETFGTVRLGDQRRTERAVKIAEAIAHEPAASLPGQLHSEGEVHAAYRLLQQPDVSYEELMRPHVQQTREALGKQARVLLIQDTTEVDYQSHPSTSGLGPIGNGSHHGFLLQSVLAVVPGSRQVLGLAQQEPFLRKAAPPGETKWQREQREQRESQVWERSVRAIGAPPPGAQWIHVGDRASDMFPFLRACLEQHADFVVRAASDRRVDLLVEQADRPVAPRSHHKARPEQPPPLHLFEVMRGWAVQGEQDLELAATKTSKARTAHLAISFGRVRLLPPRMQEKIDLRPIVVEVVRVWEPDPPQGVDPLEWVLLTSVPMQSVEQAWERVEWYRMRWIVEDYHQGLKTGCRLEQRQLQSYEGLRRLLGLLAPAAVRLLQLRAVARQNPEQPASQFLPTDLVQVVASLAQVPAAELTAQQCWHTMARYGGYLGRTGDGPPGWKTLWKGWLYIQALLEGVHLAARLSLDWDST
jgi:Transposase DNA-binding/Transposase Tn5 dimerisation domain